MNAELIQFSILNAQLMRTDERRDSGSTGVHAALLAPSGAVHAVGRTRRRLSPRQRQYGRLRQYNSQFPILNSQLMQNDECRINSILNSQCLILN